MTGGTLRGPPQPQVKPRRLPAARTGKARIRILVAQPLIIRTAWTSRSYNQWLGDENAYASLTRSGSRKPPRLHLRLWWSSQCATRHRLDGLRTEIKRGHVRDSTALQYHLLRRTVLQ